MPTNFVHVSGHSRVGGQAGPGRNVIVEGAMKPGLFIYYSATAPISMHVASGSYGLILVER